ncbi:MAG: STAS domain-containing protein [Desulfamplus sp.]|nr:STAS domain-containing protein [Desulfamplus sp.]MBF0242999.1 STAS domain-containing protein [Desulfamplus sp.]MBF0390376.1 STAS domain-containing protein [Desulfamplus sp.]
MYEEVTILKIGDSIVVPIQVELHDSSAKTLQENILQKIERFGSQGLIIDVSAVLIIDSFLGRVLIDTASMAKLMGAETVVVGMRKEVVLTLLHLGLTMKNLHTALNIEDGFSLLNRLTSSISGNLLGVSHDKKATT